MKLPPDGRGEEGLGRGSWREWTADNANLGVNVMSTTPSSSKGRVEVSSISSQEAFGMAFKTEYGVKLRGYF